jgi:hypothetical protein
MNEAPRNSASRRPASSEITRSATRSCFVPTTFFFCCFVDSFEGQLWYEKRYVVQNVVKITHSRVGT